MDSSGSRSHGAFARLDHEPSSSRTSPESTPRPVWRSTQESLLSESSCPIWPRSGMWDLTQAYELQTSGPATDANDGLLLPTPQAREDGKSPEGHLNMKQNKMGAPRKQITSLAVLARANFEQPLLPTPSAWLGRRPENDTADPERARSREHEGMKGKRSMELPDALALIDGVSTGQSSPTGKASSVDQYPNQLSMDA